MVEFLGVSAPSQLLLLMLFPLGGAILMGVIIVVSLSNRSKKAKMKHGIAVDDEKDDSSELMDSKTKVVEVKAEVPVVPNDNLTSPANLGLNMNMLQDETKQEVSPVNKPIPNLEPQPASLVRQAEASSPPIDNAVELMRLLRHPQSGQLIIEIGGQRYEKLADITDKKVGQFILKLAAHLLSFTNGMIVTEAGVKSIYNPKVGRTPEPLFLPISQLAAPITSLPSDSVAPTETVVEPEPIIPEPSPEAQASFEALRQSQAGPRPEPPPLPPPVPAPSGAGLFRRGGASAPAPVLPVLNLADEINKIVQARLIYSPLSAANKIVVASGPDGGIRINVNGQVFSSPDEISDPDVKNLIKESIKQWERS